MLAITEANRADATHIAPAQGRARIGALFLLYVMCVAASAQTHAPPFDVFDVPAGSGPHDVAPSPDGTVWYTAQARGAVGRLDPRSGKSDWVPLGEGSAPHGVIVAPDHAAWITDGGLNAIVRVDAKTLAVSRFPLPKDRADGNLNTAVFDKHGHVWFTGQNGIYGDLDPASGRMRVFDAPRGRGPYGIAVTPDGGLYYASLAGSYLGRIDPASGATKVIEPPTPNQGARRVWSDSKGRLWVSEWTAGKLGMFDPAQQQWREWALPGQGPHAYAIFVDDRDIVWLSEWTANALVRFDPRTEHFDVLKFPQANTNVRQMMGRKGEVWLSGSGVDRLLRYDTNAGGK